MKVLFIAHFREGTGWSHAAIDYALAMDSIGIDVVCRNVDLTGRMADVPTKIKELENKTTQGCDFCIQNVLPHHLVGSGKFKKNIAIFFGESENLWTTNWFVFLQQMDEVWVSNPDLCHSLFDSRFLIDHNKIEVVPCPFDPEKLTKKTPKISMPGRDHQFKFYYIGELNDRKNIASIIRSFHAEFDTSEQVALILKVKKFGQSPEQTHNEVKSMCENIKTSLRMYQSLENYHQEIIISDDMSDDGILALHRYGDCFVSASHGEGWSIPAFDAMCLGKTPICSNSGGPSSFIDPSDKNTGTLINGVYSVCRHGDPAFPDIFTGREEWFVPSESEIKSAMRHYFSENQTGLLPTIPIDLKFSYNPIGDRIKDLLNE